MLGALGRKIASQNPDPNIGWFGFVHAGGPLRHSRVGRRTFDVKHRAAVGQECGKLSSLNSANLFMIGRYGEDRDIPNLANLCGVINVAVEHDPADSRIGSSTGYNRQSGSPEWLHGIFAVPSTPPPAVCRSQRRLDAEKTSSISSGEVFSLDIAFYRTRQFLLSRRSAT